MLHDEEGLNQDIDVPSLIQSSAGMLAEIDVCTRQCMCIGMNREQLKQIISMKKSEDIALETNQHLLKGLSSLSELLQTCTQDNMILGSLHISGINPGVEIIYGAATCGSHVSTFGVRLRVVIVRHTIGGLGLEEEKLKTTVIKQSFLQLQRIKIKIPIEQ